MTLEELRDRIKAERPFVGRKPYSHNIISLTLGEIHREHGIVEANRAIRDFNLAKLGWSEVTPEETK